MKLIYDLTAKSLRNIRKKILRIKYPLLNYDFTLITNNCLGGIIYKDLNIKFNSPTINLFIEDEDYLKFIENLEYYINFNLVEEKSNENYPIGKLDDIKIHFLHYKTFTEAKEKWVERTKRINYENIFFIMSDTNEIKEELVEKFDSLPIRHKILFSNQKNICIKYKSSFYIEGFNGNDRMEFLWNYRNLWGDKYFDQFDFISWFNQNKN